MDCFQQCHNATAREVMWTGADAVEIITRMLDVRYGDTRRLLMMSPHMLELNDQAWIRNDLALTQLRLGDAAACRKTLEPLAQDASKSDASIREDYPGFEADAQIRLARATRTNLKLCQGQAGK